MQGLSYLYEVETDYTINRGEPSYKDRTIARTSEICRLLRAGATNHARKYMGAFGGENPEFENEIAHALACLKGGSKADIQKAVNMIDSIRSTLFKRFAGAKITEKRLFDPLPQDVADIIAKASRG